MGKNLHRKIFYGILGLGKGKQEETEETWTLMGNPAEPAK